MRMTIKLKLGLAFATIIVLSTVTAVLGLNTLSSLNATLEDMVNAPAQKLQWAEQLMMDRVQVIRAEKNMILATAPDQIDRFDRDIVQLRQELLAKLDKAEAIASAEGRPKWQAFRASWQQFLTVDDKLRDLAKHSEPGKAQELSIGQGRQLVADAQKQLSELVELSRKQMALSKSEAARQYDSSRVLLSVAIGLSLLIAIGAGVWIALGISRGLGRTIGLADAVAIGDLDQDIAVSTNDEIKDVV